MPDSKKQSNVNMKTETLFDYESKANELLTAAIKQMKKERKPFDFHKFKAQILGKDYEDT